MRWYIKDGRVVSFDPQKREDEEETPRDPDTIGMIAVYIAGPYSTGDNFENVRAAIDAGQELLTLGFAPFVPHLFAFWHFMHPHPWAEWIRLDVEWLERCDALLRIGGTSTGADLEVAHARERQIPVFHSVAELVAWRCGSELIASESAAQSLEQSEPAPESGNGHTGKNGSNGDDGGGLALAGR